MTEADDAPSIRLGSTNGSLVPEDNLPLLVITTAQILTAIFFQ